MAGARRAIEDCFQTAKTEVGLDQYQVRGYDARIEHHRADEGDSEDGGARA